MNRKEVCKVKKIGSKGVVGTLVVKYPKRVGDSMKVRKGEGSMRERIKEIIHLSVSSQLFLLKHKEVKDAIEDMNEVADKILSLLRESVPETEHGGEEHYKMRLLKLLNS